MALWRDAAGTGHSHAGPDARVACLVPSITELMFDLGLGARLVGRTRYCIHPRGRVEDLPQVGGTKQVRLESLRALAPTHVVVNVDENTREDVDALARFVPHVIVTHPIDPLDNLALYRMLGGIFGAAGEAERLCDRFGRGHRALAEAAQALPHRRVLYLIWRKPWMTVGADTYIARMLALVRWQAAHEAQGARYPRIELSPELAGRMDLILLSTEPFPFDADHVRSLREALGPQAPPVRLIDGEMLSWYGSRAIAGLEYLGRFARDAFPEAA
ncbi:MAG: helical backbone metal receptor [Gammaproteobacteria bacterium]